MGFSKPSDIAIVLGIALLVILTVSLGVDSIQEYQNVSASDPVFTTAANLKNNFQNTSSSASEALTTSPGQTSTVTDTNIYVASFNAVLTLGEMISSSIQLISQFTASLGIPSYFGTIIIGMLLVVFAVITYSWFRGNA